MSPAEAAVQRFEARDHTTAQTKFFKADHPRAIDRYIDYFGSCQPVRTNLAETDLCGEQFLNALIEQAQRPRRESPVVSLCRRNDNLSLVSGMPRAGDPGHDPLRAWVCLIFSRGRSIARKLFVGSEVTH